MGPLEILIVLAIALVVFGGYFRKRLPEFGRTAGEHARIGGEKAKELADQASVKGAEVSGRVGEKVGDRFDPGTMGRSAGKHVRDAREFRESFRDLNPMKEPQAEPQAEEAPAAGSAPATTPASASEPARVPAATTPEEATPATSEPTPDPEAPATAADTEKRTAEEPAAHPDR